MVVTKSFVINFVLFIEKERCWKRKTEKRKEVGKRKEKKKEAGKERKVAEKKS